MAEEKIFTINLRQKFQRVPNYQRARVAVRAAREFLQRHIKKDVLLGRYLNNKLHEHGRKNPPHKVQVKVWQEKDAWKAELVGAPLEEIKEAGKKIVEKTVDVKEEKEVLSEEEKKKILEKPDENKVKQAVEPKKKETTRKAGERTHKAEVFSKTQKPKHEKKK